MYRSAATQAVVDINRQGATAIAQRQVGRTSGNVGDINLFEAGELSQCAQVERTGPVKRQYVISGSAVQTVGRIQRRRRPVHRLVGTSPSKSVSASRQREAGRSCVCSAFI